MSAAYTIVGCPLPSVHRCASLRACICPVNTSPTVFKLLGLQTFSTKLVAVKSLSIVLNFIICSEYACSFWAIRVVRASLLGHLGLGAFLAKSQWTGLIDNPMLMYLRFLSLHTLIISGDSLFLSTLDL